MVVFAVHGLQRHPEVGADLLESLSQDHVRPVAEHIAAVLGHKDQVHMQFRHDAASATIIVVSIHEAKYHVAMRVDKAFRYRIYPTPDQAKALARIAGCCRVVYNLGLEQRRVWGPRHRIRYESQAGELPALKAAFPWLAEAPSHCLQQALIDLDSGFKRFFGGSAGCPRPRLKRDGLTMRFPDPKQIRLDPDGQRLVLPKFGKTRSDGGALSIRLHRPHEGKLRSVTVSYRGGLWYASLLCSVEQEPLPAGADRLGLDMGIARPIALSDGGVMALTRMPDRLVRQQRLRQQALARTRKGSASRRKAVTRLAATLGHIARRREDAAHKATRELADRAAVLAIEDLRVRNMTASARGTVDQPGRNVRQKAGLNRSMLDVSPRRIRTQLAYKTAWRETTLVAVPPHHSSRTCSDCGHVAAENRESQAVFRCRQCGHQANADTNAARVILQRGLARLGIPEHRSPTGGLPGMACGSSRARGRKQEVAGATL